jgi:4a-hydroxytetrahydrobiopterin dehydratase
MTDGTTDVAPDAGPPLTRRQISDAVGGLGWRFAVGVIRTSVLVDSLASAAEVARVVTDVAGDADGSLSLDLRPDRVVITLQSRQRGGVGPPETDAAGRISAAVDDLGLVTKPEVGSDGSRSVQVLEIAIDALDIPAVRPFWRAVMGYGDEPGSDGSQPGAGLADPVGQGPTIWFQQMDEPRPQRNRIHFDVVVPHDETERRIQATLDAGGRLINDSEAPAFWVLADPEGNEACVCTWLGRDLSPAGDNVASVDQAGVDHDVETRLRAALRDALKTRDVVAAFAVRSALGAIGNAGAVPADAAAGAIETAPAVGTTEAARRQLSPAELQAIVEAEISERQATAGQYEQTGHGDRAETLRREARVLQAVLDG